MSSAGSSLVTSALEAPGIRRVKCGRGFRYTWPDGTPLRDQAVKERIKSLVIPPAWADVWICPDATGHIQATEQTPPGGGNTCITQSGVCSGTGTSTTGS